MTQAGRLRSRLERAFVVGTDLAEATSGRQCDTGAMPPHTLSEPIDMTTRDVSTPTTGHRKGLQPQGRWDLFVAAGLTLLAALVVVAEPAGSTFRLIMTLPMLFLVPGYLLIQTLVVPAPTGRPRAVQALVAIGVSPAVVGVLALATTLGPNGFRAGSIVALVTIVSLVMVLVAYLRRWWVERALMPRTTEKASVRA